MRFTAWGHHKFIDTDFGFNLPSRFFGLMFEKWLGPDYETGLTNLKRLAESLPAADWSEVEIEITRVEPTPIAYVNASAPFETEAIGQALGKAYAKVRGFVGKQKLERAGAPVAITVSADGDGWSFKAGVPRGAAATLEIAEDAAVQIG